MANDVRTGPLVLDSMEDVVIPPDLLRQVVAPSLFLWGSEDPMGGADIARSFTDAIPGATLHMIEGAGHAPWLDDPDRVGSQATKFLSN